MESLFVQTVLHFTSENPQLRSQAHTALVQFESNPSAFQTCLDVLKSPPALASPHLENVLFHALRIIQVTSKSKQLFTPDDHKTLIQFLLVWVFSQQPPLLVRKALEIIVDLLIFDNDQPTVWVNCFRLLVQKATSPPTLPFPLFFLEEMHTRLIEKARTFVEYQMLATQVKNAFRQDGVQDITSFVTQILRLDDAQIKAKALNVFSDFVSWIDLSMTFNAVLTPLLFQHLERGECVGQVLNVLCELVAKGMPPTNKIMLVYSLDLTRFFPQDMSRRLPMYDELFKLVTTVLGQVLEAVEKQYPANGVIHGSVQFPQQDFVLVQKIITDYFMFLVALFRGADLEKCMEFTKVISATVGFYTPYLCKTIDPTTLEGVIGVLYQAIYTKFMMVSSTQFDDDETNHLMQSLRSIFRSTTLLDCRQAILTKFLQELLSFNVTQGTLQTVSCHAYLLLYFPDQLSSQETFLKSFFVTYLSQYAEVALKFLPNAPKDSPILPSLARFIQFLTPEVTSNVVVFTIRMLSTNCSVGSIKNLIHSMKRKEFVPPPEWGLEVAKIALDIDTQTWTTHRFAKEFSEEVDVYAVLGDFAAKTLAQIIQTVFTPQVERCKSVFSVPDPVFVTNYLARRLACIATFMQRNRNQAEYAVIFQSLFPVVEQIVVSPNVVVPAIVKKPLTDFTQLWIDTLSPQFVLLPPFIGIAQIVGTDYIDLTLLCSLVIHLVNKQLKTPVQLVTEAYSQIVQYLIRFVVDLPKYTQHSEEYRERFLLLKSILPCLTLPAPLFSYVAAIDVKPLFDTIDTIFPTLTDPETAKALVRFAKRMCEIVLAVPNNQNPMLGINTFLGILSKVVLAAVGKTNNYGMVIAASETAKAVVELVKTNNVFMTAIQQFLQTVNPSVQTWLFGFFSTILSQSQPITPQTIATLLNSQ